MIGFSGSMSRSSLYLVLLGAAVAILAGFAVSYLSVGSMGLSRTSEMWLPGVGSAVAAGTLTILVGRYLPFVIWSPIYGFVAVYLVLGSVGYIYYRLSTGYIGSFYDIGVSNGALAQALSGFLVALASFLCGALVYMMLSRRFKRLLASPTRRQAMRGTGSMLRSRSRALGVHSFIPLLVPALLFIVGKGPGNIWYRNEYLVEQYHFVYILGTLLSLPVLLAIGYVLPAKKNILWRIACAGLFILYEVLFLNSSSRRFVVAPLFFIIGLALGGIRRRTIMLLVMIWMLALPLLSTIPLELRGMSEQGLLPLLSNLEEILTDHASTEYLPATDTLVKNITFSVPLAGYVNLAAPIPEHQFLVSINPLPSFVPVPGLPPWDSFRDQLRVSPYIPFNTLGELLNQGWVWLILYYVAVGLVAAWADIGARSFEGQRSRWGFLIACGMLDFFAITSTQYNLRSATRFIYYAILVAVAWKALCRLSVVPRVQTARSQRRAA